MASKTRIFINDFNTQDRLSSIVMTYLELPEKFITFFVIGGFDFALESEAVFDLDQFIADCRSALAEEAPQHAIREAVMRAVADQAAVLKELGEPKRSGIQKLLHSADLTILNVVWAPRMTLLPHDHRMWAVIGIYTGREDNIFWRRVNGARAITAAGAKSLGERDVALLGRDIIHSVTNPLPRLTGAIHVYTGDFFGVIRSEWDPETLLEQPYDVEKNLRLFEEANAAYVGA